MEHSQPFFVTVESPTWLLYAALLLVAVFFRFSRLISVRNLDLLLLLTLSTTLVMSAASRADRGAAVTETAATPNSVDATQSSAENLAAKEVDTVAQPGGLENSWSKICVLVLSILFIVRLIFDEALTRRPRLEQNLNQAGLTFLCLPAFAILMAGVFFKPPPGKSVDAVEAGVALLERQESTAPSREGDEPPPAPTPTLVAAAVTTVSELSGRVDASEVKTDNERTPAENFIACILAVVAHTTVVLGLIYIGRKHFCSTQLGVSMSCLYLLLPCTAFHVHELSHVVPAACLTWAFANYRRPAVAGVLLGLACGTLFFAVFLLPLWAVFYGRKGSIRFGLSLGAVAAVVLITFALTSENTDSFVNKLVMTANWSVYRLFDAASPVPQTDVGQVFLRITLAACFFVMLVAMTVIPRKRNLENLLANSTALIIAAQLWYPEDVGSYVLWYLPLLLLVVFRPRLDRFVPPESPTAQRITRPADEKSSQPAGALSRVTLYN